LTRKSTHLRSEEQPKQAEYEFRSRVDRLLQSQCWRRQRIVQCCRNVPVQSLLCHRSC